MKFKSESEINKTYVDHLESLIASGLPFDEAGIRHEWEHALFEFRTEQMNKFTSE